LLAGTSPPSLPMLPLGFCVLQTPGSIRSTIDGYLPYIPSLSIAASVGGRGHAAARSRSPTSDKNNYKYLRHWGSDWDKLVLTSYLLTSYSVSVPKRKKKGAFIMWLLSCRWSNPAHNAWLNRQAFISTRLIAGPDSLALARAADPGLSSIGTRSESSRRRRPLISCSVSTRPASPERPEHVHQVFPVAASHRSGLSV